MLDRYDSNEFENVGYYASSGGISCPDSDARIAFYGNNGYPHLLFNGTTMVVGAGLDAVDGSQYDPIVQSMLDDPTPLRMEIYDHGFGATDGFVELNLGLVQDLADISHTVIRIAIVEDGLSYDGEVYDNVLRDILPTISLTIDEAFESQLVDETFPLDPSWNTDNLRLIAWTQNDTTKDVLQSCNSRPTPPYSLRYYALGERSVIADGAHTYGEAKVFNHGTEVDDVTVSLDLSQLPEGWDASFRIGSEDYTSFNMTLAPGEPLGMAVTITPGGAGQGTVTLVFHSESGEVADKHLVYSLITSDTEILLVDDDGAFAYETEYFAPALDLTGKSYAIWDRNATGVTDEVLANFDVVVWQCGWAFPTVDADDRAALAAYLDGGGSLFITGQDIGWEMNDQGGDAIAWYQQYLHASYIADDTNMLALDGVPGDPIGDGLTLRISGGDGADNQEYPSDIDPRGADASVIFTYDANRNGAIKADTGVYKVVYFAFGYEAIDNADDRGVVMQRIIEWLAPGTTGAGGATPQPLVLLGNVPNPFNPQTDIVYRLGSAAPVEVAVYDLLGRRVRRLEAGLQAAGEHRLAWDGRDDGGRELPTGTYLYRVRSAGQEQAGKMVLVR